MTSAARVTVVVPVWGPYRNDLEEALASIRRQSIETEIVVVDNGSEPPIECHGVVLVRSHARLSLGEARSLGAEVATAPLMMLWDADDVMVGETLKDLVDAMERDPALAVCATSLLDGRTGLRHHWPRRWPLQLNRFPLLFAAVNIVSSLFPVSGAVMRTAHVAAAGLPPADAGDDWALGAVLAFRGRIAVLETPGRVYMRHASSVSSSWKYRDAFARAAVVRRHVRGDAACPPVIRGALPMLWAGQLFVLLIMRPLARLMPLRRREAG